MTDSSFKSPSAGPEEVLIETPWQKLVRVQLDFGARAKTLIITDYGVRASVVLHGAEGVLLTRQYRYLIDTLSWEVPGGRVEPGEDPEEGARRECLEETGFRCGRLNRLIVFQPGLDVLRNPTHVFVGSEFIEEHSVERGGDEISSYAWVPLEECIAMIHDGRICDALSIVSLLIYSSELARRKRNE